MARLSLRGLTRRYEGAARAAVSHLDLEVEDGELVVFVGPSGCGKSTALRMIAGLDAPDAGSIRIGDRDVTHLPPQDRDVAMVFQGYALYPHLSARDNIAFPLKMRGVDKATRARKVDAIAEMLALRPLLHRLPGELSGGERQRVAMGRAIVREPQLFLFDEPLANLDAALRAELRVELAALVRRLGVTAIYVTHDQTEAMTMGDRILVMDGGEVQHLATPREIYEAPANAFVAGFLGTPPINFVNLERDGQIFKGAGARWTLTDQDLPSRVRAGFRPEHATLARTSADAVELLGVVLTAEPLGAETHLFVDVGGSILRAKAPGFDAAPRGSSITLFVEPKHLHFFDAESGARLVLR
jgi:multiple sugar transport system ATP-binding protein